MKARHFYASLVFLFLISSCKKEKEVVTFKQDGVQSPFEKNPERKGSLRYIAVGNSITAGYADGGLYRDGQIAGYPNIIAAQLKTVGFGSFTTPLFPENAANGSSYLKLAGFNADGSPNIVSITDNLAIRGQIDIPGFGPVTLYKKFAGDIDNYGVPGIKVQQITYAPYGNLNGFYERMLPGEPGTHTTPYIDFVTQKPYDFFSCWLGNNDAQGYASTGGEGDVLTDKTQFAQLYQLAIATLTSKAPFGVIATVPYSTSLPFYTTITVHALVAGAIKINPSFNHLYINARVSGSTTYITRVATEKDLILLSFNTSKLGSTINGIPGYGLIPQNPLVSSEVLDKTEVDMVADHINYYNSIIKSLAEYKHLALFDANAFLQKLQSGMVVNGVYVDSKYISGSIFGLDGVHLTPRGNALAADQFIKAINDRYRTNIPLVDISQYKGVY